MRILQDTFLEKDKELYENVSNSLRRLIKEKDVKSDYCDERCVKIGHLHDEFDEIVLVSKTNVLILTNKDMVGTLVFINLEDLCRITDTLNSQLLQIPH